MSHKKHGHREHGHRENGHDEAEAQAPAHNGDGKADNHRDEVPCAFCGGRKTDPFNILSERSRCEVCRGTGTVTLASPHEPCAFCNGTGNFKTFSCPVCKGKGALPSLSTPTEICPECEGHADESSGLPCLKCHGRGKVPVEAVCAK